MSMTTDDETLLSAYLDGELPAEARAALARRLGDDEALQRLLAAMERNDERLKNTFDSINSDPLPQGLSDLLAQDRAADTLQAAPVGAKMTLLTRWPAALAASFTLALGVLIGQQFAGEAHVLEIDSIQPSAHLAEVLNRRESGSIASYEGSDIHMELSFVRRDGAVCRQYSVYRGERGLRAISCRENSQWSNKVVTPATLAGAAQGSYVPANAEESQAINAYIAKVMAGVPLADEEEREILKQLP